MFQSELAIMLYVENINDALNFWQGIGFVGQKIDGNAATIKPAADSQVTVNLYAKAFIREVSPEVVDNVASLMFQSNDFDALHAKVTEVSDAVGEIVVAPGLGRVFNFADPDCHYYAVCEVK
ncbi:MAG: hypothetical protein ACTIDA_03865 [Pseudolactococcus laudensis]